MKLPVLCGTHTIEPVVNPVFIADLHLTGKKLKTLFCFFWFLHAQAAKFRELFILGDFFEYWIGDDGAKPAEPVARALRNYAARGHKIYMMQGNRDFLLGEDFAAHCSATLIRPQTVIETPKCRILLSHGDEWCTLDSNYQEFRAQVRDLEFQKMAFGMTVQERIDYAKRIRQQSSSDKMSKTAQQMDIVEADLLKDCRRLGCTQVIHGHTHKPAVHRVEEVTRTVIPDWDMQSDRPKHRGWVRLDNDGLPQLVITDKWW